jgi:hypothetical protein
LDHPAPFDKGYFNCSLSFNFTVALMQQRETQLFDKAKRVQS